MERFGVGLFFVRIRVVLYGTGFVENSFELTT